MKIKIFNKNRIDTTQGYEEDNLQSYDIVEGFTYTKTKTETLDSASIRLSHLTQPIDIEPFDRVMLYDDGRFDRIFLCVDNYTLTQESLDDGAITYQYEISLFSETKMLEGVILPNLSITPRKTGTKETIWYYLHTYLNKYAPKIRVVDQHGDITTQPAYDFDRAVIDKFVNITAPEMQWSTPTLKAVITDLMMVADCIPTMQNGVISYMDLTETKGEVENYNYIQRSRSSDDYISEIKMNMQNVLQTSTEGIKSSITTYELIPFTSDDYLMTTDNFVLKTKYPILNIKTMYIVVSFNGTTYRKEITDLVKESKEYQTLEILRNTSGYTPTTPIETLAKYQNFCIYYNRGGNEITGFTTLTKQWIELFGSFTTSQWLGSIAVGDTTHHTDISPYSYLFLIDYETTANQVFSAGKNETPSNYRQIVDNQTNAWIDAYTQGNLEYQKANRLGNESMLINQRCVEGQQPIEIGDKLGEYIVYQVQYQIYKHHIEVNASACKNYILKDYYTGINSKVRTWVNAKDEAFVREELEKVYCEFSYQPHTETMQLPYLQQGLDYFLFLFHRNITGFNPIETACINVDGGGYYLTGCLNRVIGNSIVLTTGFSDNTIAGRYSGLIFDNHPIFSGTGDWYAPTNLYKGGAALNNYFYVDDYYEADNFEIVFMSRLVLNENDLWRDIYDLGANIDDEDLNVRALLPLVDEKTIFESEYNYPLVIAHNDMHKDNKEIPVFTYQFEFCSETRDIYFTKSFINKQLAVRTRGSTASFSIYTSSQFVYNSSILPDDARLVGANLSVQGNRISVTGVDVDEDKYLYIVGDDNAVLLCFRLKSTSIFLNILKDRNKNIYDKDLIKVGAI